MYQVWYWWVRLMIIMAPYVLVSSPFKQTPHSTHLISSARAMTPDASGQAALVPVKSLMH